MSNIKQTKTNEELSDNDLDKVRGAGIELTGDAKGLNDTDSGISKKGLNGGETAQPLQMVTFGGIE